MKQIQELESRNSSLQLTVDRMSNALAKSEVDETDLKGKVRIYVNKHYNPPPLLVFVVLLYVPHIVVCAI